MAVCLFLLPAEALMVDLEHFGLLQLQRLYQQQQRVVFGPVCTGSLLQKPGTRFLDLDISDTVSLF